VVGALTAWILPAIFKWQRQRARKTIPLELINEGNVRSRYALHAAEPTGKLEFHFRLNGQPLPEQVMTVVVAGGQRSAISRQPSAVSPKAVATGAAPVKAGANVQKTLSGASQKGGVVAGLLSTLGRLLPGTAGQSLSGVGREVRQGQQTMIQAQQAAHYAGKLQPKPGASSQPSTVSRQPSTVSRQPSAASRQPEGEGRGVERTAVEIWVQTPFVEPGGKMRLDLQVQPARPYQTRHYPYVLKSRSLEYKEAPVMTAEETVLCKGLSPFERFAPFLLWIACITVLLNVFLSLW